MTLLFPLWREYLIGALLIGVIAMGVDIYYRGYDSCEATNKEAALKATAAAEASALSKQNQYQDEAAKMIISEKAKSSALEAQLNALQKLPCDNDPIGANRVKLYDNTDSSKTNNSGASR